MKTIPVSLILTGLLSPLSALAQAPDSRPAPGPGPRDGHRPFVEAWKKADKDGNGSISREEFDAMPRIQNIPEDKRPRLFARLDKNQDGSLDRRELQGPGNPPQGPRPAPMRRLWELDTDKSGGVSMDEFKVGKMAEKLPAERLNQIFQRLDSDGDGQITPKDRPEPPHRDRPEPPRRDRDRDQDRGKNQDRDRDNPPPDTPRKKQPEAKRDTPPQMDPQRLFQRLDTNNDKVLSFKEFQASPMAQKIGEDAQEDRFEEMDRNSDGKLTPEEMRPPQQRRDPRPPRE